MSRPLKRRSDEGGKLPDGGHMRDSPLMGGPTGCGIGDVFLTYVSVGLGCVIGSVLRALVSLASVALLGAGFPLGTLFVNVTGSFLIGFYATLTSPEGRLFASSRRRQFVMTGVCGGYTTFSMFSLETLRLAQSGHLPAAALNVGISLFAWLAAVWLGHVTASRLNRLRGS
jgi:fluoride exporter